MPIKSKSDNSNKSDNDLLKQIKTATKGSNKSTPAGKIAVETVISKETDKATFSYNIRLKEDDDDIIQNLIDTLRQQGIRKASSADAVRVALRSLTPEQISVASTKLE